MKIRQILEISQGKLLTPHVNLDMEILGGYAGDLMSDVLASIQPEPVLITGLSNPQVIRTALIADVRLVIFARGKQPPQETITLAIEERFPIITSDLGVYEISGRLMQNGLPSFEKRMLHAFDRD